MERSFSGLQRRDHLEEMAAGELDLLVIGGGIAGAGIALDEMMPRGLTGASLTGFAAGALLLAWGTALGQSALTFSGALLGTAAWALYGWAMAVMHRR